MICYSMLQNNVYIDSNTHTYWDYDGNQYVSLSRAREIFKRPFDKSVARHCAGKGKYVGMSEQQVLQHWDDKRIKASDHGTKIHNAIETYTNTGVLSEDETLHALLQSIGSDYREYARTYSEEILYSPSYASKGTRIAGTTDRILQLSARGNVIDIEDYKTNLEKGIQLFNKDNKYFLSPFEHMQDCNFNDYSLQLSVYAFMAEELFGYKVRSLWIRYIPADNPLNYRRIPVPYMKSEVINFLEYYHKEKSK